MTEQRSGKLHRREFLRTLALTGLGLYGLTWRPRSAAAQLLPLNGAAGSFRVLVRIELLGGCDQHGIWLPLDGARFQALAARRPNALFTPTPDGTLALNGGIGLHPRLAPLLAHLNETKLFLNTSNDLLHGQTGSHEDAQNIMSIGGQPGGGRFRGWTAALYDNEPNCRLIGFVGSRGLNTACDSTQARCSHSPPPTVETFEAFRFDGAAFSPALGGAPNSAYVADVIRRLAEAREPEELRSTAAQKFNAATRGTFPAIEEFAETLNHPSPLAHLYGSSRLARQLRNVAMKIKELADAGSNERYIFTLGVGGFDVHRDWAAATDALMLDLGQSLGTFMSDLKAMHAEQNTLVITGTEFGRKLASNGSGTDHGNGSTTIVMGGSVNGGSNAVYGDILSASEFSALDAAPARVDARSIIAEALDAFMGIDPAKAFPEPLGAEPALGGNDLFKT